MFCPFFFWFFKSQLSMPNFCHVACWCFIETFVSILLYESSLNKNIQFYIIWMMLNRLNEETSFFCFKIRVKPKKKNIRNVVYKETNPFVWNDMGATSYFSMKITCFINVIVLKYICLKGSVCGDQRLLNEKLWTKICFVMLIAFAMEWWEDQNKETILRKKIWIFSLTLSMLSLLVIHFLGGCVLCSKRFKRFFFGISLESLVT